MRYGIITGGASGIGKACVDFFRRENDKLFVLDNNFSRDSEIDNSLFNFKCDVSKVKEIQRVFQKIRLETHRVDFLVNGVGIQEYGTITDTSEELWDRVMNVNLRSTFLMCKYAIPLIKGSLNGVIVNIASVQSFVSQKKVAAYTTSKSAILGLTRSIAIDFSPDIRCIAVCPGSVNTNMLRNAIISSENPAKTRKEIEGMHLLNRIAAPEEIASLIGYLCTGDCKFITGQAIRVDGGLGIEIGGN